MSASSIDEEQVTIPRVAVDENNRQKQPIWAKQSFSFTRVSSKCGRGDDCQNHPEEGKQLVRKTDIGLLPVLAIMYALNYLDRTNIVCHSAVLSLNCC
jgi:hypothetical protein